MYLNYQDLVVEVDSANGAFSAGTTSPAVTFVRVAAPRVERDGRSYGLRDYRQVATTVEPGIDRLEGTLHYTDGPEGAPEVWLRFRLSGGQLTFGSGGRGTLRSTGTLYWGDDPEHATLAVRMQGEDAVLRAASGPAVTDGDRALFDRLTDRLLELDTAGELSLYFDWEQRQYGFSHANGQDWGRELHFRLHSDYCRRQFGIPYRPIRKAHGFVTPPVGWMSWYALQFTTDAAAVLANARKLAEVFGPYDKKLCCWVDWEWMHSSFEDGEADVDTFSPRPGPYPEGLKPVAAALRELGVTPALWVGPTNEWHHGRIYREHPEWLLGEKKMWCGRYWIDLSHPEVIAEFIPAVFRQVREWGFAMVKWDCLPATLLAGDAFHDRFHRPEISSGAALRAAIAAGRAELGDAVYMLSCSGETERDITLAMDLFDAARIGGDVFEWEKFVADALNRVYRFYCWHNVALYADADNLVLREEFNTLAEARSRVSFYGLAGLPVTLGDDLTRLPEERLELLKRIVPTVDVHPRDLRRRRCGERYSLLDLAIARPFGAWHVAGVLNLTREELSFTLDLERELGLPGDRRYALYDFWNRRFLGIFSRRVNLTLSPHDTALLRITEIGDRPEVIGSSRHVTQGAVEFAVLEWLPEEGAWHCRANCVPGETWEVGFWVPEGWRLAVAEAACPVTTAELSAGGVRLTVFPDCESCEWTLRFLHIR